MAHANNATRDIEYVNALLYQPWIEGGSNVCTEYIGANVTPLYFGVLHPHG